MTDLGHVECAPGTSGCCSQVGLSSRTLGRALPGRLAGLSSSGSPGRLTSLKSRDLTLGGFKKPKKIFEPNVKAVRKSKEELREEMPKERRKKDEKNRKNRGRRRERPQTIQSHSIFEQGPADTIRKTAWRGTPDLCEPTASPLCKSVKKEKRDSEEDDTNDEILGKLHRDDFIDDPDLRNDARLRPIQLPLYQSSLFTKTETPLATSTTYNHRIEEPSLCSTEPPLFNTVSSWDPQRRGPPGGTESAQPALPSLGEVFQELSLSGREELFFIQLPDCMPGRLSASKGEAEVVGTAPEDKAPGKRQKPQIPMRERERQPGLSDFSEGMLGKLLVRQSGKVQLKMGDIVMDVSEGAAFSFLQQLVSVGVSDGRKGDMTVLGNVQRKLVCSPDFQSLLWDSPTQEEPG